MIRRREPSMKRHKPNADVLDLKQCGWTRRAEGGLPVRSDRCRLRSLNSLLEELRVREYLTTRPCGLIREDPVGFIPPSPMPFRY